MKRFWILFVLAFTGGTILKAQVEEMKWELDYEVFLSMSNDSTYTYDIRTLFHVTDARDLDYSSEFVFYPVNPGEDFAQSLKRSENSIDHKTLWSALHANLGGGWVHFTNCLAYALETRTLNLKEPIMKRPETNWKPNPVTESWKRTRKWEYYIPVSQKLARKEYSLRLKNDELGDLKNLPEEYIGLFLSTSDRAYQNMLGESNYRDAAKIDLVRIMLGTNYLGKEQINYISNAVINAINSYSSSKLPSVIIFDEFSAAAAMSLDENGYRLESVAFSRAEDLSPEEVETRKKEIGDIIMTINQYNQQAFEKRLGKYYETE
ncbi:MAG: hypothetical protein JW801_16335 [Bacteroidales bacterium]|nr:hypothetical protein [Bacteroidales bacterium]